MARKEPKSLEALYGLDRDENRGALATAQQVTNVAGVAPLASEAFGTVGAASPARLAGLGLKVRALLFVAHASVHATIAAFRASGATPPAWLERVDEIMETVAAALDGDDDEEGPAPRPIGRRKKADDAPPAAE